MERLDILHYQCAFIYERLESITGLRGDALVSYCNDQGYSCIFYLIADLKIDASCVKEGEAIAELKPGAFCLGEEDGGNR
jgi:hypothetical protein